MVEENTTPAVPIELPPKDIAPPTEIETEEGRKAIVLRRAEDLCRRGKVPKCGWQGVFDSTLEEYIYFIKYGNDK